ncbi:MAG: hypothetical protein RIE32_12950 [Phycisphaerales bacterium]
MTRCPKCRYDAAIPDATSRVVCPECGFEYLPAESSDAISSTNRSALAAMLFTVVLAATAGLGALAWLLNDDVFARDRMPWWYAAVPASIVAAYALIVRVFSDLFNKCWPRPNPGLIVYLLFATGSYAVIAIGLLWLRGVAAQS